MLQAALAAFAWLQPGPHRFSICQRYVLVFAPSFPIYIFFLAKRKSWRSTRLQMHLKKKLKRQASGSQMRQEDVAIPPGCEDEKELLLLLLLLENACNVSTLTNETAWVAISHSAAIFLTIYLFSFFCQRNVIWLCLHCPDNGRRILNHPFPFQCLHNKRAIRGLYCSFVSNISNAKIMSDFSYSLFFQCVYLGSI